MTNQPQNDVNEICQNLANLAITDDSETRLEAVRKLREVLSSGAKLSIDAVVSTGVVPTLVQCLESDK